MDGYGQYSINGCSNILITNGKPSSNIRLDSEAFQTSIEEFQCTNEIAPFQITTVYMLNLYAM